MTHGLEETSHSQLRICTLYSEHSPYAQRCRNSEKFHLRTWIHFGGLLQTQTRSARFNLSCLDGFIQQKQQNPYTQEIGRREGEGTTRDGVKLPHCGQDSRSASLFSGAMCVAALMTDIGFLLT